ncbi:lipopolysaccharide assembly protein LapA domain-containing protein [Pullulanibacillus sp. KACC 23026]|uniref:LapA family protein n=1 Tax=Pullulanibacillus sp. KACC 23026 TaxID=3028315 RepID=UPI0023B08AB0|nr:lipopolysaccharide assembly protein LapA domain-containing protein [Pullulanibacillus sp. KACC 23026]WEG14079.1 lipopolysaccharide assembly protein LapA domain-containing protein [Pullulanibacillus sp. KACC 23026]
MKGQWGLILGLVLALVIAIFSVINVSAVTVNYLFGQAEWPLILVVLGSVLMGGLVVGSLGVVGVIRLKMTVKRLEKQLKDYETKGAELVRLDKEKDRAHLGPNKD